MEPTPEPEESMSSSVQAYRTASEPVRKPSQQHHLPAARLKVASDESLGDIRAKKPKSGIELR